MKQNSNFTGWSQLVYIDSHANFALEQILILGTAKCLRFFTYFFTIKLYTAFSILVPQEKLSQKHNLVTQTRSGVWGCSVTTRSTGSSIIQSCRYSMYSVFLLLLLAVSKSRKIFRGWTCKLLASFTVISDVYRSLIRNKNYLINTVSLSGFEIPWLKQYLA